MRKLLTLFFAFAITLSFGQKKTVAYYLADYGIDGAINFTDMVASELNKNEEMEFVQVDAENYSSISGFDYFLEITSEPITEKVDLYDEVKNVSHQVKGKDGKSKTVTKKVPNSGIESTFNTSFHVQAIDVKTMESVWGVKKEFKLKKRIDAKVAHFIQIVKNDKIRNARRKALLEKHMAETENFKAQFYSSYIGDSKALLLHLASLISFDPPVVTEIVKEKKGKAIVLRLKGSKYALQSEYHSVLAVENADGTLDVLGAPYVRIKAYQKERLVQGGIHGKKKTFDAFQAGKKIIALSPYQMGHYQHCGLIDKTYHVATILLEDENTYSFDTRKFNLNNTLRSLANVKIYEFQNIPDLKKTIKQADFKDLKNAVAASAKLEGIDFVFMSGDDNFSIINTATGDVKTLDHKHLLLAPSGKSAKKKMVSMHLRPDFNQSASWALSIALGEEPQILKVDKEKKGKAKHVIVKSMVGLPFYKYLVFDGTEEIGELKIAGNGNCSINAKVKSGGKKILEAMNAGKRLTLRKKI